MKRPACPSDEQLGEVLADNPAADSSWVVAHLEDCPECQARLDRLVADESVSSWARAALGRTVERGGETGPNFLASLRELVPREASCPSNQLGDATAHDKVPESCPTRLGLYDILAEIGRGGMAIVYKARQPLLDRIVALKRLRLRDQDDADVARFLREAESIARVPHPNIVQVL